MLARAGYAASAWAVNDGDAGDDDDEDFRDPFPQVLGSKSVFKKGNSFPGKRFSKIVIGTPPQDVLYSQRNRMTG